MWYYNGEQFKLENYPNDSLVGFVYEITEKDTGKKYIGKKLFWSTRRKKVKGRTRRVVSESDWKDYVVVDPKFYRPAEVDFLLGSPQKAKSNLGWKPQISFTELAQRMVEHDINEAKLQRSSLQTV